MVERQKSPWVWVGCGCVVATFIAALAVATVFVFGARSVRELQQTLMDPVAREQKALETLNAASLPEGYYPMVSFSLPFVVDFSILSDLPVDEAGEPQGFDQTGFIYLKVLSFGNQQKELMDFFEGRTDDPAVLRRNNINIRIRDLIGRGALERDDADVLWVSHLGDVGAMGSGLSDAVTSIILIECPSASRRMRMGIWFGPHPDPDAEDLEAVDWSGSVADGREIESFLEGFRPCA